MDLFKALAIGASSLQILDHGIDIVEQTKIVLDSGFEPKHRYLWRLAQDLDAAIGDLTQQGISKEVSNGSDSSLAELASQCQEEAQALITRIDTYAPEKRTSLAGRISNIRKHVNSYWEREEIEDLKTRINIYRVQLNVRMLALFNLKRNNQGSEIVQIHSLTRSVKPSIEVVGAVLKDADGSFRTILNDALRSRNSAIPDTIIYKEHARSNGIIQTDEQTHEIGSALVSMTQVSFRKVTQKILDSLWFRLVTSREQSIDEAFSKTFGWIFSRQNETDCAWDHFPSWLQHGKGCYWVNGKAGSGKSTLLKFIGNHPALLTNLKIWAGNNDLLISTFFFWRAGQELQKSQEGLLRSLLFQILEKRHELVAVCFPELCCSLSQSENYKQDFPISFKDLQLAFKRLITHQIPNLKIFILIDGLDEYQGDYKSLSALVLQAAHTDMTKILVSSRPVPPLVEAFAAFSNLKVQDLTISDIKHYTTTNLGRASTLKAMTKKNPGLKDQLIDSIVSKASGVFLWVVLVVRKVLEGLETTTTKEQLLSALDGLPVDLEQLYAYMFNSMTATYQEEASWMIQLFVRSETVQFHYPMTALQLSFANEDSRYDSQENAIDDLSMKELDDRQKHIEEQLRSRCCGLLEIQRSNWGIGDHRKYVGFLHRTVMDFFEREEIWNEITSWNRNSEDWLDQRLVSSCLKEIHQDLFSVTNQRPGGDPSASVPPYIRHEVLDTFASAPPYSRRDESSTPDVGTRILHGIVYCSYIQPRDKVSANSDVKQLWDLYSLLPRSEQRKTEDWAVQRTRAEALVDVTTFDFSQPVLMFAASYGFGDFSGVNLKATFGTSQSRSLTLLNLLMNLNDPPKDRTIQQLADGAIGLLKHGVDPNEPGLYYPPIETANTTEDIKAAVRWSPNQHNDLIPWIYWLSCKRQNSYIAVHYPRIYMEILEQMIQAGATIQGRLGSDKTGKGQTIFSIIEDCLDLLDSNSLETVELRTIIQSHLRQAGLTRAKTKLESPIKSESSWISRFKAVRRSTHKT